MHTHLVTLALAGLLAGAPPMPAVHARPVVDVPRNIKVSPRIITDRVTRSPFVWVAYDGYKPRRAPGKDIPSGAAPLAFMEACVYAAECQTGRDNYLLLVKADADEKVTQLLGWVSDRYIVRSPQALSDPATKILRKGMIVNTLASLKQGQPVVQAPVLLAPDPAAKPNRTFSLFNIYFIYADTDPTEPDRGYVLLGSVPRFNEVQAVEKPAVVRELVLGWVPKSRVCLWSTREALEWDTDSTLPMAARRRRTPGRVYRSIADAKKGLKGEAASYLFEEVFVKGVSQPFPHDRTRYPVVALDLEGARSVMSLPFENNTLRRVGIVGGFVDEKGREVASQVEVERLQRQLAALAAQVETTELLFVIDDTGSMDVWFKTVAQTVESIIDSVKGERNVRIAITYYNDVEEGASLDKAVVARRLVGASSPEGRAMVEELKRHKATDGGDPREQMFHGIKKGVETAGFQPNARKIVIVLGDMADKSNETDPQHAPEKAVRDMLLPAGQSPIEFYAIQVIDPLSHTDARAFRTQIRTLLKLTRAELVQRYKMDDKEAAGRGGYFSSQNKGQVRDKIRERYTLLRKQAEKLKQEVGGLRRGEWTRISPELERILTDRRIDIARLRGTQGFQLFEYGYVWEKSAAGDRQTRVRLLVSDGELEQLIKMLSTLDSNDPGKRPSERDIITRVVQTHIGEQKDDLKRSEWSFENVVLRSKGLTARSWLLRRAIDDIREDAITSRERQNVLKKKKLLEDARANREYDYRQREVGKSFKIKVWDRLGEGRKQQRLFSIGADRSVLWCWVDFDKEWP